LSGQHNIARAAYKAERMRTDEETPHIVRRTPR
jgi:hypothetical protein